MDETKLHRLRVGDNVEYRDDENVLYAGAIEAITNDEATYVLVKFEDGSERELTEEEVRRVP